MAKTYMTSDDLIASIKRRASIPISQSLFLDSDLLQFADEETSMGMVPSIMRMREDYLQYTENLPLVSTSARYTIPYRSVGNKLKDVAFVDNNGNYFEMTRISKNDLPYYNGPILPSRIYSYYIENDEIVLVPESQTIPTGNLSVSYYMKPNSLVMLDEVAIITDINRISGVITFSSLPTNFTTNSLYDFVQLKTPHKTLEYDVQPLSLDTAAKTITFTPADIPSTLVVGDHVPLAGQTAIPQLPSDLHMMLAQRTAARCLEAMGDLENLQAANAKIGELNTQLETIMDDRVESSPRKIVPRHAILRNGLNARRFRR